MNYTSPLTYINNRLLMTENVGEDSGFIEADDNINQNVCEDILVQIHHESPPPLIIDDPTNPTLYNDPRWAVMFDGWISAMGPVLPNPPLIEVEVDSSHLSEEHLLEEHLPEESLPEESLPEESLPIEFIPKKFIKKKFIPRQNSVLKPYACLLCYQDYFSKQPCRNHLKAKHTSVPVVEYDDYIEDRIKMNVPGVVRDRKSTPTYFITSTAANKRIREPVKRKMKDCGGEMIEIKSCGTRFKYTDVLNINMTAQNL